MDKVGPNLIHLRKYVWAQVHVNKEEPYFTEEATQAHLFGCVLKGWL